MFGRDRYGVAEAEGIDAPLGVRGDTVVKEHVK